MLATGSASLAARATVLFPPRRIPPLLSTSALCLSGIRQRLPNSHQCCRSFAVASSKQDLRNQSKRNNQQQPLSDNDEESTFVPTKRLDVAIVGFPNAGKSQLLNAMLGTKVAAVSRKRHTTRDGIMGVASDEATQTQIVFCDTPGFMTTPENKISHDLTMMAKSSLPDVDFALVVIDAAKTKLTPDYMNTISSLMWNALQNPSGGARFSIVLNKVDLVKPKTKLLDSAQTFGKMADTMILETLKQTAAQVNTQAQQTSVQAPPVPPEALMPEIFFTCAKQGQKDEGVQDVLQHLRDLAIPNRDWLLPDARQVTPLDYPARVEEIIREKVYRTLHREVPHQIQQRNRQLELVRGDTPDKDASSSSSSSLEDTATPPTPPGGSSSSNNNVVLIQQDLLVRSKSHLNLLQKSSGMNLQRIHDAAVPELRKLFQCEVFLTLNGKLVSRNRR